MGISLNHLQRFMPGQMHHVVQGHTSLYQSRSKGVAEVMKTKVYDPRFLTCRIKRMLEALQGFWASYARKALLPWNVMGAEEISS